MVPCSQSTSTRTKYGSIPYRHWARIIGWFLFAWYYAMADTAARWRTARCRVYSDVGSGVRVSGKDPGFGKAKYSDAILDYVVAAARDSGFRELCLFVDLDNRRAISVYGKHGFQTIGQPTENHLLRMFRSLA